MTNKGKPKSGTKSELHDRLRGLCKTHGDQGHFELLAAAKNKAPIENVLSTEWALYRESQPGSWFRLLCDDVFDAENVELRAIMPHLARHVLSCYGFYLADVKVFRFPNLPILNTPIDNFRRGFLNCLSHWRGVHHFPWCFYGSDNELRAFDVVLDCGLNLQKGHLSDDGVALLRPILEHWTEDFLTAYCSADQFGPKITLWTTK